MLIPILIVVVTVFFSFQSMLARKFTENYEGPNPGDASQVYNILYGTLIALFTLCIGGFRFSPSRVTLLFGLLNACILVTYNTALVSASVRGPFSFMMLSLLSGGILVPMLYNMVLGEQLSALQISGIGVLMASIVCMNLQGLSFQGQKPTRLYFLLCAILFLANGFYGQIMNLQQTALAGQEREEMIIVTYLGTAVLATLLLLAKSKSRFATGFRTGKKALLFGVGACVVATTATNLLVYLIPQVESVTILYAIDNCGVMLLSALYSILLFREKPTPVQVVGMSLSVASIVLLSL